MAKITPRANPDPARAIAGPAAEPRRFGRILGVRVYGLLEP